MLSNLKKDVNMKFSEYIEFKNPNYIYLKLTPNNSLRNNSTDQIAKAITSLYKSLNQCIYKVEKKLYIEPILKVSYYIYLEKSKVNFYFIIPEMYLGLFKEKISNSWKGLTISRVDEIPLFSSKASKYYLTYKRQDGFSLSVDKRSNTLLNSLLSVVPVLKEGDKVGIFYNFIPISQYGWKAEYEKTIQKFKDNVPLDKDIFGASYIFKMLLYVLIYILEIVESAIFGVTGTKKESESLSDMFFRELNSNKLSDETIKKKDLSVINAQIMILSEGKDRIQQNNNIRAVCESFSRIEGDNTLIYKRIKDNNKNKNFNPAKLNWDVPTFKASTDECHNFIQLPARELLEEHNCIEKIETQETEVPKKLQSGIMCIGKNTYRGHNQKAYLSNDKELRNLPLTLVAPTRSGKTTLIQNLSRDSVNNSECTILFDFCGNSELSNEVSQLFPSSKILNIDCGDISKLQGLGYNEINKPTKDTFNQYRNAKTQTSQLITLINSINKDDKDLPPKMERYLESASLVVFISNGSIKDVFGVLQDHRLRHEYISKIPKSQIENLEEYILSLEELDEYSKGNKDNPPELIGTRISNVVGILDRVNKLKRNTYMELMLKRDCSNNIDLVDEIQKSQLICLKMSETMFSTETEKDIYCTYWITKIWLALQIRYWNIQDRSKHVKVNIIVDELYQVPYTQEFIRSKLSQMAKFTAKMIISCHYLGQIGIIRNELKAANTSYILISGVDKDNYNELKSELYPYTIEDVLSLKRYHSLNLIKYEDGYAKFITKLPPPVI